MADENRAKARRRRQRCTAAAVIFSLCAFGIWGAWKRGAENPERIRQDIESDFRSGHYEHAAASLATLSPPTSRDILMKAQVAMALGHSDEALTDLAQISKDDPAAAEARLLAGQVDLRRDRVRLAEKSLLEAIELNPDLVQAHRQLVYIYGMLLRRRELNEHFQALSRLAPMTFDNVFHWCLTRNTVWEPHERLQDLRRYVAADPDDRGSRVALAETLRQVGRREEAASVLSVLPESDLDARAVRARIALDRGDDPAFEAIIAGAPTDHLELTILRGRFALAHGDGATAVRLFRSAHAANPNDRDIVFGLGTALALVGDNNAAPLLRESKAYDNLGALMNRAANPANHKDPALMRALGAACEAVHRNPEARAWYKLAVETNPLDGDAQKALYRLGSR